MIGLLESIVNKTADRIRCIHCGIGNGLRRVGHDPIVFGVVAFRYVTRIFVCLLGIVTGAKTLVGFGCLDLIGLFCQIIGKGFVRQLGGHCLVIRQLRIRRDWLAMVGNDLLARVRLVGSFGEKAGQILRNHRIIGRSIFDNRFYVTEERRV